MEIRTVRKPGERGTQRLVAEYGERLVCVRYRYDPARNKRYKTVELIVAEDDWRAPALHRVPGGGIAQTDQGGGGGMWDPSERLWFIPEEEVRRLGLVQRVTGYYWY